MRRESGYEIEAQELHSAATPRLRVYRSGLHELGPLHKFGSSHGGRGWRVLFQAQTIDTDLLSSCKNDTASTGPIAPCIGTCKDGNGNTLSILAPELQIEAPSVVAAQRALNLICAAKTLIDGGNAFLAGGDLRLAWPDVGESDEELSTYEIEPAQRSCEAMFGFSTATEIAAKSSRRRKWTMALVKYALSCRYSSTHSMDLDPAHGLKFSVAKDPYVYLAMSHAIFTAFSAIEDMDLKVNGEAKDQAGRWKPGPLKSLEGRLLANNVEPKGTITWHLRATPTRIERKLALASGSKAAWATGSVRDRNIPITDAIYYSQRIRNQVCGHATNDLTRSLTAVDVVNVRDLLRRLILEGLGFWHSM